MKKKNTYITGINLDGRNLTTDKFLKKIEKYENLEKISCSNNEITNLDHLPCNLKELNCEYNQITHLDYLPQGLEKLYCGGNKITKIDHLPNALQILHCDYNNIDALDYLPTGLQELNCDNNQISALDYLPKKLQTLNCDNNNIKFLDYLPPKLEFLNCENNEISRLCYIPAATRDVKYDENKVLQFRQIPSIFQRLEQYQRINNAIYNLAPSPDNIVAAEPKPQQSANLDQLNEWVNLGQIPNLENISGVQETQDMFSKLDDSPIIRRFQPPSPPKHPSKSVESSGFFKIYRNYFSK